jgi:hypothetical protein
MGFVKTAILTDFAVEQDISAKLNIAKRMAIIATIEQEILSLKSQSGDVIGGGVQIELGNAMLREIYNQNKHIIEDHPGGSRPEHVQGHEGLRHLDARSDPDT